MHSNTDKEQEQNLEELGRELKHLKETVCVLDTRVQEIQQLLQQQQQQVTSTLQDSVDQLNELATI